MRVTSFVILAAATVSVASATTLKSVFETVTLGSSVRTTAGRKLLDVTTAGMSTAQVPNSVMYSPYEAFPVGTVIGDACITSDDSIQSGTHNLNWKTVDETYDETGDKLVSATWGLATICVPNVEVCVDLSEEGCEIIEGELATFVTLLGWDGYTTLQSVWDQVKDDFDLDIEVDENADGSTSVEGYNLALYRLGDVCPVTYDMCKETIKATFPIAEGADVAAATASLQMQACILAGKHWTQVTDGGVMRVDVDLVNCPFTASNDEEVATRRRLAGAGVSIEGSLTSMNAMLGEMVSEGSAATQLAADPAAGFDILTPTAEYGTDKKTNEGSGLDIITLIIIGALIVVCLMCCCCCCCYHFCCKKKSKTSVSESHMQMSATVH
jgi:hypothetical protein